MKFYRTVFRMEVLSTEPLGSLSLSDINYEITEGHCSGMFLETREEEVSRDKMRGLLVAQGTDPEFLLEEDE